MVKKLLLISAFFLFTYKLSLSQGYAGKEFWVTFLEPDIPCFRPPQPPPNPPTYMWQDDTLELYFLSPYAAIVTIQVSKQVPFGSGIDSNYTINDTLKPNKVRLLKIPAQIASHGVYSDYIINNGVHVFSDSLINLYAVTRYEASKGSTAVLPVSSIPYSPEYIVTTNESSNVWNCYPLNPVFKPAKSGEFAIVGIADRSVIEIVPTGVSTVRNNVRGIPFSIVLYKGETFGYISTDNDLSGSIIRSKDANSKFAVFAGNRQTYSQQLNSSGISCKSATDHTYEQLFPTVTLGTSYTALPLKNNKGGYYLKVVAVEDFTRINLNGNYYKTLKQGEFFVWNVSKDTATRVSSDKRISVTQFALGYGCNQHPAPKTNFGGVSQLQLVADHQFSTDANFSRLIKEYIKSWGSSTAPENYLNVLVKKTDTAQFRINGKAVPNSLWTSGNALNGYCYAQLDADSVNYHLTSGKGFIAYAYGYSSVEGNAFVAGAGFKPLLNNFYVEGLCLFDSTTLSAVEGDSFANYSWHTGIGSSTLLGKKVKVLYKDTGWYNVVMYFKHVGSSTLDSVTKRVYVNVAKSRQAMLSNDTVICGKVEFNVYSKNFNSDNTYLWQDGHRNYIYAIKNGGQYWEKVMERNGCFFTDTLNVTNYENPKASFTASDTLFCANKIKEITFTNTSKAKDTIVYVEWDFGDLNKLDTNRIVKHLYKKADLYMVLLKVETDKGCKHDTFKLIEILKAPKASFTMSYSDSCISNNMITYTNTTVIDSAAHMRYKWHFSDSFVISNSNPPAPRAFTIPGKSYAELIYENWDGCIDTMKKDIIIYAAPKPVFSFPNTFNCNKDSIRIINKTTSIYKPIKSKWTFGDGKSDTAFNPVHFYATKGTYNVKLIATIPQGCKDSTMTSLKIFGSPKADFTINDDIQCIKDNRFKFVNKSTTDTGNFPVRKWTYSDGTGDQNTDTAFKSFGASGKFTVNLKVAGIFGCTDSITKTVDVKNSPVTAFTANQASQCWNEQNFVFTYVPKSGNDSISGFAWYFNKDSIKNTNTISNIKFPVYGKYPVRLKLISKFGCEGETIQYYFLNASPVADFKVPKTVQCLQGNAFNVVSQSSISQGSIKAYNWDYGDFTNSGVIIPPAKTYTKSGDYNILLTLTSDSGCTDTASVMVHVRPNAVITIAPVPEVCLNDSSFLNASATLVGGVVTNYQWEFGDNSISDTMANPAIKHFYKVAGVYSLKLTTTSDKGCKDSKVASNWVTINTLPNAAFSYTVTDGQNSNSLVAFSDLTQPKPFSRRWDFGPYGTARIKDTTLSIIDTTTMRARLYITDSKGCTGMIEKVFFVSPPGTMYFANAFTANGDGINDGFGPVGIPFATEYKFVIYNRWGEMVFQSNKLGETWDGQYGGKQCQNGVYIYKLEFHDFFGHYKDYKGTVLMMW